MSDQPVPPPADETPAAAPAGPPARGPALALSNVLALAAVPALLILGVAGWFYFGAKPQPPEAGYSSHIRLAELRLGDPTRLDARYADADGDLIADPPAKRRDPEKVVFSGVARYDPAKENEAWSSFLPHLEKACGRKVEYYAATSTSDQLDALREGRLDVAFLNTGAVPVAVNAAGFVPAWSMATADGTNTYHMLVVVPAKSPVRKVEGLRGATIAFTSPSSLSGFKAPLVLLRDEFGLRPGRDYQYLMVGDHRVSIRGVASGLYQAAAVASDYLDQEKAAGLEEKDLRVLYKGPPEPGQAVGLAHDLPDALAKDIRAAFGTFDWKGSSLATAYGGSNGYVKFTPVDYKKAWEHAREIDKKIMAWSD